MSHFRHVTIVFAAYSGNVYRIILCVFNDHLHTKATESKLVICSTQAHAA